jgi:hypothetical protein
MPTGILPRLTDLRFRPAGLRLTAAGEEETLVMMPVPSNALGQDAMCENNNRYVFHGMRSFDRDALLPATLLFQFESFK